MLEFEEGQTQRKEEKERNDEGMRADEPASDTQAGLGWSSSDPEGLHLHPNQHQCSGLESRLCSSSNSKHTF